jgi:hypothetical protein
MLVAGSDRIGGMILVLGGIRLETAARCGAAVGAVRTWVAGLAAPVPADGNAGTSELTAAFRAVGDCAETVQNAPERARNSER